MPDDTFELSRRKALAGLGTIGVASAGAGLGTSAFFSDTETFQNNILTAGELDLKMDWQEHYSDWSADEEQYAGMGTSDSHDYELPGGSVGESIFLTFTDQQKFMATTAREAYPDDDNDGINDYSDLEGVLGDTVPGDPGDICDVGADTPEDLDPRPPGDGGAGTGLRTFNDDTWDSSAQAYKSLINISDVKPGDFGEVTFSLHLCDNPGYLWMFADNLVGAENGVNEPEADDGDEDQIESDPSQTDPSNPPLKDPNNDADGVKTVELLDKIQARVWYDGAGDVGGDNLKGDNEAIVGSGKADVPTLEGSLRDVITKMSTDPGVPLDASNFCAPHVGKPANPGMASGTTSENLILPDNVGDVDDVSTFTCVPSASVNPSCRSQGWAVGVKFDESELPPASDGYTQIQKSTTVDGTTYIIRVEVDVISEEMDGQPRQLKWRNLEVSVNGGSFVEGGAGLVIVKGGPRANLCTPDDGPTASGGDHVFEPAVNPTSGNVPAISHFDICLAEIGDGDDGDDDNGGVIVETPGRQCLANSTTVYIGFEWWLPIDHGNEVQSDSASFDLGFYTEQCRHNDGSGMSRTE